MPDTNPLSDAARRYVEAETSTERIEILCDLRKITGAATESELIEQLLTALAAETQRADDQEGKAQRWFNMWKGESKKHWKK